MHNAHTQLEFSMLESGTQTIVLHIALVAGCYLSFSEYRSTIFIEFDLAGQQQ